jgi:hypothetical protein
VLKNSSIAIGLPVDELDKNLILKDADYLTEIIGGAKGAVGSVKGNNNKISNQFNWIVGLLISSIILISIIIIYVKIY